MWRSRLSNVALALTFVFTLLTGPLLYAGAIVDDSDRFVAVTDQLIDHPNVRSAVAEEVATATFAAIEAEELVASVLPDDVRALAVPLTNIASDQVTRAAFELLDTGPAVQVRHSALRELHRQLTQDSDDLVIDLRAVLVRTARDLAGPTVGSGVATLLVEQDRGRFTLAESGSDEAALVDIVRTLPELSALAWLLTLLSLVLAVGLAVDRRRALLYAGIAIAAAGLVAIVVVVIVLYAVLGMGGNRVGLAVAEALSGDYAASGRSVVVTGAAVAVIAMVMGDRPAARALRSLPGRLWRRRGHRARDLIVDLVVDNPAVARLVIWAAGALLLGAWTAPTWRVTLSIIVMTLIAQLAIWVVCSHHDLAARTRATWRIEHRPAEAAFDARGHWRTNVAVALGALFFLWPEWRLGLVVGFFVVLCACMAVLDMAPAIQFSRANAVEARIDAEEARATRPSTRRRTIAVTAVVVALAIGGVAAATDTPEVDATLDCNGSLELCDRRIDQVVFAGSHNSMSSTELGWQLAMQTGDIVAQLDHGVRALLIDTHYWDEPGDFEGGDDAAAKAVIDAAIADTVPQAGTWLCHGFCGLGATAFGSALADLEIWMRANPREVVIVLIQDEISTADTLEAFANTGLDELIYQHDPAEPFPTLGRMIELDQRLLFYAENEGSDDSWYQNMWSTAFTETPFTFAVRSDFSCDPNRGEPDHPLFLLNHWVTTGIPVREAASVINSRSELIDRVEQCEAELGRLPTILAVDFVETGDLIDVVDELNGAGSF